MIYGINFNGTPIPTTPRTAFRKFPQRVKVTCRTCGGLGFFRAQTADGEEEREGCDMCPPQRGEWRGRGWNWFELKGIGQSKEERDAMLIQANNGTRRLHVEERQTASGVWYGIYTL